MRPRKSTAKKSESRHGFLTRALFGLALGCSTPGSGVAQTPPPPPAAADSLPPQAATRQTAIRRPPGNVDTLTQSFARATLAHDWAGMATYGRTMLQEHGIPPHVDEKDANARTAVFCAQLLTAYIATDQPDRVESLVAGIKARFNIRREIVLRIWYAAQLRAWLGTGPDAPAVVDSVLQSHPSAPAMHRALLLHAVGRLATMPRVRPDSQTPREARQEQVIAASWDASDDQAPYVWPSEAPPDTPFPRSTAITGIEISGTYANYGAADWWYTSWGADDVLYTTYAGGTLDDSTGKGVPASVTATGRALVRGDDPLHLTLTPLPPVEALGTPYSARFPSADLMYHGVWYVGTYTIDGMSGCPDFCILGPLVGFHWSADRGHTWHAPPASVTPAHPVFGEAVASPQQIANGARVKLSAAHFVDFGKDMQYSPDGKAYLIGHGATAPDSRNTWASGDQIYLARVTPSPGTINDVHAWEFYAGRDARGRPRWSRRFTDIKPLLEWKNHLGGVTVTYDAPLKKYLMFTTHQTTPSLLDPFDLMVLEADRLTGPWRLVSYMKRFGPQAYSVNLPSKFISADGRTVWLSYAGNFGLLDGTLADLNAVDPPGSGYWMHVHKIRLLGPMP